MTAWRLLLLAGARDALRARALTLLVALAGPVLAGLALGWTSAVASDAVLRVHAGAAIEGGGAPLWARLGRPVAYQGEGALVTSGSASELGREERPVLLVGLDRAPCVGSCPCAERSFAPDEALTSPELDAHGAVDVNASGGMRFAGLFARSVGAVRRFQIGGTAAACGLGGVGGELARSQPRLYVSRQTLGTMIDRPGSANRILRFDGDRQALDADLDALTLAVAGLSIRRAARGYFAIEHEDIYLPSALFDAVMRELGEGEDVVPQSAGARTSWASASLATDLGGIRDIPRVAYALVALVREGDPALPRGARAATHEAGAERLGARPGDELVFSLADGDAQQRVTLSHVLAPSSFAADPDLVPSFPGIARAEHCRDFELPIAFDASRITAQDEAYWSRYRGVPHLVVAAEVPPVDRITSVRAFAPPEAQASIERALVRAVKASTQGPVVSSAASRGDQVMAASSALSRMVRRFGLAGALGALLLSLASAAALGRARSARMAALARDGLPVGALAWIAIGRQCALAAVAAVVAAACALTMWQGARLLAMAAVGAAVCALGATPAALWCSSSSSSRAIRAAPGGSRARIALAAIAMIASACALVVDGEARVAALGGAAVCLAPLVTVLAAEWAARSGVARRLAGAELSRIGARTLVSATALTAASLLVASLDVAVARAIQDPGYALVAEVLRPLPGDIARLLAGADIEGYPLRATPGGGGACTSLDGSAELRVASASPALLASGLLDVIDGHGDLAPGEPPVALVEQTTAEWLLGVGAGQRARVSIGGTQREILVVGVTKDAGLPGTLIVAESTFDSLLPDERGARLVLFRQGVDQERLEAALDADVTLTTTQAVRARELSAEAEITALLARFVWLALLCGAGAWALASLGRLLARRRALAAMLAHGLTKASSYRWAILEALLLAVPAVLLGTAAGLVGTVSLLDGASIARALPSGALHTLGIVALVTATRLAAAALAARSVDARAASRHD